MRRRARRFAEVLRCVAWCITLAAVLRKEEEVLDG